MKKKLSIKNVSIAIIYLLFMGYLLNIEVNKEIIEPQEIDTFADCFPTDENRTEINLDFLSEINGSGVGY